MKELGPAEFSAATGLSVKALRLYDERGLLVPARVNRATGYRRYADDQIVTAGRIALLRRAGIGLADIERFLAAPAAAVIDRWLADLAAETAVRRRALDALASALGFGTSPPQEPAVAVIIRPVGVGSRAGHGLRCRRRPVRPGYRAHRPAAFRRPRSRLPCSARTAAGCRRERLGRGRRHGFRVRRIGGDPADPGRGRRPAPAGHRARPAAGFRSQRPASGRNTHLPGHRRRSRLRTSGTATRRCCSCSGSMTQARFEAEVAALTAGPVKEMTWHRDSFGGVPQLFVDLDEPSPLVRAQVQDLACGAHVGYCMTKAMRVDGGRRPGQLVVHQKG